MDQIVCYTRDPGAKSRIAFTRTAWAAWRLANAAAWLGQFKIWLGAAHGTTKALQ